jgi:hypothetical protein
MHISSTIGRVRWFGPACEKNRKDWPDKPLGVRFGAATGLATRRLEEYSGKL